MALAHEYTGKSVDEAIRSACDGLSMEREQLDIEVVSPGSAGIFGLCFRKAKIRVKLKKQPQEKKAGPVSESSAPKKESVNGDKKSASVVAGDVPNREGVPAEVADMAKQQLEHLLEKMGCPSTVAVSIQGQTLEADISGEHLETVVGDNGQVLDSVQYLLRKILSKQFKRKIIIGVDAGGYRDRRRQQLEELAVRYAAEVKESGRSRTLSALNPAERRIVHMAIQDDETIRSRSVGDGIYKKIVIFLPGKGGQRRGNNNRRRARRPRRPAKKE